MSNLNDMQQHFMNRYRVEDVHIEYQQRYERVPYDYLDPQPYYNYHPVKMATVKLPMDMLEQIMYDLEMKYDELDIRMKNPAALDAYHKYKMIVELLK